MRYPWNPSAGGGALLLAIATCGLLSASCSDGGDGATPGADAGSDAVIDTGLDAPSVDAPSVDAPGDAVPPEDTGTGGATGWSPPYDLPGPGEKKAIPTDGRNVAVDIKPTAHSNGSWQYALFQSYGGGSLSADYSPGGAYVIAGTGGHNAAPNFGAAIFDFTDGKWSYLPNANGFDENRSDDVTPGETSGAPYLELTAVTTPGMPAPSHTYLTQVSPKKSALGGSKGGIVHAIGAAQTTSGADSPQSHQLDLASGLWSRASTNLRTDVSDGNPYTDSVAAYDVKTSRIYHLAGFLTYVYALPYLDLADMQWKKTAGFTSIPGSSTPRTMFIDDARRLLVVFANSGELYAWNLEDVAAGPTKLAVSGTLPTAALSWHLYPEADGGDGSYYAFRGKGAVYEAPPYPLATDQFLLKLTPPASSPLTNPWVFSTAPISGGITAEYVVDAGGGAMHHSRFFYVPSLRVFAWIPNGTGAVELIKP
jgi:hypothetical protein